MQEDIRKINEFVKENKINEIEMFDLPIWPLIKVEVSDKILKSNGFFESRNTTTISLKKIIKGVKGGGVSFCHLMKLILMKSQKKEMFVGFARRSLDEGIWVDKFHDPILKKKNNANYVFIEKPYKFEHFKNSDADYKPVYYDFEVYFPELLSRIISPLIRNTIRNNISKTALLDLINDNEYLSSLIARKIISFKIRKFISDLLFKNIRVENLYLTNRSIHYPMILSAKENNIKVHEFQHGIILNQDVIYNDVDEGKLSVDYFLTFSPYWCENYSWAGNSTKVIPYGFQYIHEKRRKFQKNHSEKNDVLVVSQPEMSKKLCAEIKRLSEVHSDVRFVVKLHPQDIENYKIRYKNILSLDNVAFIDNFDVDNYELLSRFNYVLGYYSTMMFEARFFDVKVIVLPSDSSSIGCDFFYMEKEELDFFCVDAHYSSLEHSLDKYFSYPLFEIGAFFEKNN